VREPIRLERRSLKEFHQPVLALTDGDFFQTGEQVPGVFCCFLPGQARFTGQKARDAFNTTDGHGFWHFGRKRLNSRLPAATTSSYYPSEPDFNTKG
jgi:hypothetical protein